MTSFRLRRIKCVIYRLDIIFSKANVAMLMVSKTNFFYQSGIRNTNSNLILCQEVEKWHYHCAKSVQIQSYFWSVFSRIRTDYFVSLRIQSECGKIWTRNNSVFGHFTSSVSDCFYVILGRHISRKLQSMHTETRQISNLRSQDVSKESLSDLVRKDFAEFNGQFYHFPYATLAMLKGAFNNYSMLKSCLFFHQQPHFCNVL